MVTAAINPGVYYDPYDFEIDKDPYPIWRRLRDALEGGMRQQITRSGLLFTVTIALVGLAAFASANNLMFLLLAALLATLLISGLVSRLGLAGLELDLALPEQIVARRKVTAQLVLTNRKSWIPTFSIHLSGAPETGMAASLYIPVLPGGRSGVCCAKP